MKLLQPNISAKGRMLRGLSGAAFLIGAAASWHFSIALAVTLALVGGFMIFEASRSWCALRACGIKTPL